MSEKLPDDAAELLKAQRLHKEQTQREATAFDKLAFAIVNGNPQWVHLPLDVGRTLVKLELAEVKPLTISQFRLTKYGETVHRRLEKKQVKKKKRRR